MIAIPCRPPEKRLSTNRRPSDERGSAMVLALGVIVLLAVLALVVASIVVSEKRTDASDYSANRSFYSADAATEAGVNWLRQQYIPPAVVDSLSNVRVASTFTTLSDQNRYKFDVRFIRRTHRPGWSLEYKDYEYRVDAVGAAALAAESQIELGATRLYREGY